MVTTREKVAALKPLVDRLYQGHCWIKTPQGPRRLDETFDDFKLAEHVAGRKAYGLAFVAPGASTCRAAALDFDSHNGETTPEVMLETVRTVLFVAELEGLPGVAFRSSGGKGYHIYFLWDEPQDAHSVRHAMRLLLAACGLEPGTKGVAAGQVEVYPKQDRVAPDGYGSMIVLPLAGESVLMGEGEAA